MKSVFLTAVSLCLMGCVSVEKPVPIQYAAIENSWSKADTSQEENKKNFKICADKSYEKYTLEAAQEEESAWQKLWRNYYVNCLYKAGYELYEDKRHVERPKLINETLVNDKSLTLDESKYGSPERYKYEEVNKQCREEAIDSNHVPHPLIPDQRKNFFEQCMLDKGYTYHPKGISGKAKSSCYQIKRDSPACNSVPFSKDTPF